MDRRHTGLTDLPLTPAGEDQARELAAVVADRPLVAVWSSPFIRARRTAELAGLTPRLDPDLREWDYGRYEGLRTAEIEARHPGWNLWQEGADGGESPGQVGARADAVLARVRPEQAEGDVVLVAHGHLLRVLAARYLGLPPAAGAYFQLGTATVCELGFEHERPVLVQWNVPARAAALLAAAPS